jgi:hypothetical protein
MLALKSYENILQKVLDERTSLISPPMASQQESDWFVVHFIPAKIEPHFWGKFWFLSLAISSALTGFKCLLGAGSNRNEYNIHRGRYFTDRVVGKMVEKLPDGYKSWRHPSLF